MKPSDYALGTDEAAIRRLEIQDRQFEQPSEELLDALGVGGGDRVVELGIGNGGMSRRIMRRLGEGGVLVGVDRSGAMLEQARRTLSTCGPARFEALAADVRELGPWIAQADVVTGRTVVHHIPMAECWLGRLRNALRSGTRVGFLEPEFRALLARIALAEAEGRSELAPLRIWATALSRYYEASGLSPGIGANLALSLSAAGFSDVRSGWAECPMDRAGIENMLALYDEVRGNYEQLAIMPSAEIDQQQRLLAALPADLPPVWGAHWVTCVA